MEEQIGAMMIGNNNECWGQYGFVISEGEEEEEEGEIKEDDDLEKRMTEALEVMSKGIVSEERFLTSKRLIDFQGMLKEIVQRWRKDTDALTRDVRDDFIFQRKLTTCWYVYVGMCERHCKENICDVDALKFLLHGRKLKQNKLGGYVEVEGGLRLLEFGLGPSVDAHSMKLWGGVERKKQREFVLTRFIVPCFTCPASARVVRV